MESTTRDALLDFRKFLVQLDHGGLADRLEAIIENDDKRVGVTVTMVVRDPYGEIPALHGTDADYASFIAEQLVESLDPGWFSPKEGAGWWLEGIEAVESAEL